MRDGFPCRRSARQAKPAGRPCLSWRTGKTPDGLPRGGHGKCWRNWLQAVPGADGQWCGSQAELPCSGVSGISSAGSWLVQTVSGRSAAVAASCAVPSLQGQPCGVAGGCLRVSRFDLWSRRGGLGRGASRCGCRGLGAERWCGGAAGAGLAAQRTGAVCREAPGAAGCSGGSMVAGSAGRGGKSVGLADAATALSLVELSVLSRRGERSVPPRPAVRSTAGDLSIGW